MFFKIHFLHSLATFFTVNFGVRFLKVDVHLCLGDGLLTVGTQRDVSPTVDLVHHEVVGVDLPLTAIWEKDKLNYVITDCILGKQFHHFRL